MFSEKSCKNLLDEIKHNQFKKFNSTEISNLEKEMANIQVKIDDIKHKAELDGVTESLSINFALLKAYNDRLERIIKAYKFYRFKKIQNSYFSKENINSFFSVQENELFSSFSSAVDSYLSKYKYLRLNDRQPPLSLFVQILALEDCGAVLCGDDFIELKKDRIYFLKKSDISHLISKNMVKIIWNVNFIQLIIK